VKQEDIKGMTLVCNGRIERRTELLSILSFRLKDAVMDEKGQAGKDALICITLAEGQLVIALEKAEGSNERSLYYKLSAMRTDRVDAFFDETQKGRVFNFSSVINTLRFTIGKNNITNADGVATRSIPGYCTAIILTYPPV
jgi:hypothetical protein